MHLHSRFGWVWREPTAPRVGSNDVATDCAVGGWFSRVQVHRPPPETEAVTSRAASLLSARWADGFLEYGCIDPRRKLRCYSASDVAGRMVSRVRGGRRSAEPNRYFASDIPASAALPQARGS